MKAARNRPLNVCPHGTIAVDVRYQYHGYTRQWWEHSQSSQPSQAAVDGGDLLLLMTLFKQKIKVWTYV